MDQLSEAHAAPLQDDVPTFWDRFSTAVNNFPNNVALVSTHQPPELYGIASLPLKDQKYSLDPYLRWSYRSLKDGIARLVVGLTSRGVSEGTPIFTFLPNMAEYILAMWATDQLGCPFVPINPRNLANKEEVVHMIATAMSANQSTSAVFFVGSIEIACQIQDLGLTFSFMLIVTTSDPLSNDWTSFSDVMTNELGNGKSLLADGYKPATATILFTSGSTSLPKGCKWVHPLMSVVIKQREFLGEEGLPSAGDVACIVVPNNHAISCIWAYITLCRGAILVYPGQAFAPRAMMDTMRREKCTHTALVPTMVHALLSVKASGGGKLETLKSVFLGGSMVTPEVLRQCVEELGSKEVENAFGMTEGAVLFAGSRANYKELVRGEDVTVGKPMAGQKIRICSPGTRTLVKRCEPGELHMSAPSILPGYIGKQSDDFYVGDDGRRWFVTGDQGYMDQNGRMFISGRHKEMVIRGGENISPAAIEAVLGRSPKLAALNVQVIGVPDAIAGEVPVAVVNGKVDADIAHELQNTVLSNMGSMYVPDEVIPLEALGVTEYPKTMAGKIQKTKLILLVRKYRDEKDKARTNGGYGLEELESTVKQIWSRVVGYEVDVDAPVSNFADSITVMKARDGISKETGRNISLADMVETNTIAGQIKLLQNQSRQGEGKRLIKRSLREGPPGPDEIIHLASDLVQFESTMNYIEKALSSYGLTWADVEDVVPAYDFAKTLAQTGIFDTWTFKFAVLPNNKSPAKVRSALESALANNRIMASFLLWNSQAFGSDIALHVLIRHQKALFDRCITNVGKVKTVEELKNLAFRYPYPEHATVPGPLFGAIIAEIEEIGSAGLVMTIHHAVVDASYGQLFFEDFDRALGGAKLDEHLDYKPWADSYFALRTSLDAKIATGWHTRRLNGLEKHVKALLPPRGARTNEKASFEVEVEDGVEYSFQAPGILALRRDHGHVTAPVILKAAVALLNVTRTQHTHALFSNLEASRMRFPFVPKALSALDGQSFEASDVAGPTIQAVTNLIEIKSDEPVLAFFERMQDDQSNLTKFAAAPLCDIMASLGEQAGSMMLETLRTQIFNWVPGMGTTGTNPFDNFERLNGVVRPDIGLVFNAGLGGKNADTVFLHLRGSGYERPQLRVIAQEVEKITRWLTAKEHWTERVGDLEKDLHAGVNGVNGHAK